MKRFLHTPVAMLVRRIVLLYAALMLCRVLFYAYNAHTLGALAWNELGALFCGALKFDTASIIYADGAFILLSLLPLHLREKNWYCKIMYWYYVVVNSLLIVSINIADSVYFRYTQKRFTADEIFFADNSNSAQLVLKFMAENWYMVLAVVVISVLLAWGYGRKVREESILSRGVAYYACSTAILALAAGLCVAGVRGGMTRMTRPITLSNATLYASNSGKANLILSNPFCILRTIGSAGRVKYTKYFSDEELPRHFTPIHQPADSAAVDLSGRNVVVFIMESMSADHSAYLMPEVYSGTGTPQGFTPFIDSLMRSGLCFKQMYSNGTRSIQAMPAVLGSIPSFKAPFVLMPQSLGESRQLPAILADKGYATAFFCGSERGSMGFGAYARSAGVERLVSREDYEAQHGTGDFDGYWGIWDEPFMQFMGEELTTMPEPFFASMFTITSHHPFEVPAKYEGSLPSGYTKIHKGVAYEDMAVRKFFERFAGEEWFARTVFVFVADHVSSEKFAEATKTYPGDMHIIGFIHTPDGALRGEVGEVTQQIDIMPTLLGMLGNTEPYFAFGRDVLNEPHRPCWSVSYSEEFKALTRDYTLRFNDEGGSAEPRGNTAAMPAGCSMDSDRRANREDPEALLDSFRAMVQQYYTHVEKKSYIVND